MAIPDFQSLMLPLLQVIGDGTEQTNKDVANAIATKFALTEDDLRQLLPSGQQPAFTNRLAWAKAYLKKARLLESPTRRTIRITPEGKKVLDENPSKVNIRYLNQFPSFDWHRKAEVAEQGKDEAEEAQSTPEELLESSYQAIRDDLALRLLDKLKICSPTFFERLVVQLLVAMGYGGSLADAAQVVGKSGDGGIDGLIKADKLGLDVLCIQAKRWPENTVGRPVVQAFAGSMEGFRAKKGVLLTTSTFSKDALEYVDRIERKIVLIGGKELTQLMIDHDIGVTTSQNYAVKKMDSDFFAEEEV
jgi:restriction system protein